MIHAPAGIGVGGGGSPIQAISMRRSKGWVLGSCSKAKGSITRRTPKSAARPNGTRAGQNSNRSGRGLGSVRSSTASRSRPGNSRVSSPSSTSAARQKQCTRFQSQHRASSQILDSTPTDPNLYRDTGFGFQPDSWTIRDAGSASRSFGVDQEIPSMINQFDRGPKRTGGDPGGRKQNRKAPATTNSTALFECHQQWISLALHLGRQRHVR